MNVIVFAPYPPGLSPGQRFRFEQWIHLLPEHEVTFDVLPLFSRNAYSTFYSPGHHFQKLLKTLGGLVDRLTDLPACRRADVVYVYRCMFPFGPPILERLVENRLPVVFDFDDAIFLRTTNPQNRLIAPLKQPGGVGAIISGAAHTTVGNDYLAQYARQFSSQVSVLPTTLDTVTFARPTAWRRRPGPIRIGWTGSSTTADYLHSIDHALRRVLLKHDVELVVIGAGSYHLSGAPNVIAKSWSLPSEIADVLDFDIGIMPLTDDEFSLGKCGFKALLYMALGIPCVVSPVGVNTSIVHDGVNGLLASTEDQWVDRLEQLIGDEHLRNRLGAAGRETAVSQYDGRKVAPQFLKILQQAAGR